MFPLMLSNQQEIAANAPVAMIPIIIAAVMAFFASTRPRVVSTRNSLIIPTAPEIISEWVMATAT